MKPALSISFGPSEDSEDDDEYAALGKKIREALEKKDDAMLGHAVAAIAEECMKSNSESETSEEDK